MRIRIVVVLTLATGALCSPAFAQLNWALFRTYTSPAWVAGQNGLMTVPTSGVMHPGALALSVSAIDAGSSGGESVTFGTGSAHYGLANLMEVSVTKKAFLVGGNASEVDGQTLGAKLRLKKGTLPVAVGATILNLASQPTPASGNSTFLIAYGVTRLDLGPLSVHPGVEIGLLGEDKTDPFFFVGADMSLAGLLLMGELVATDEQGKGGILNLGVAMGTQKRNGLRFGISVYDFGDENRLMGQTSLVF